MKVKLTVFYEDGSSGICEIEKPAGAHPQSINVLSEGLLVAEAKGKRVVKIGWSSINPFSSPGMLVIDDELFTRQQVLAKLEAAQCPIDDRYKPLYCSH